MEEEIEEPKEELLGGVDVEPTEAKTSEVEQSDEESLVDQSDEDIENDTKGEDAIEIVESKDGKVSVNIAAKLLNKARNLTTEQILTILAISVLIFSAFTGILAQTFNEVDREATSYEMKASEYASEARTIESMENQIILREEILLIEIKNLAMQESLYEAEVELLNSSMSKNTDDYNKATLVKESAGKSGLRTLKHSGHLSLLVLCAGRVESTSGMRMGSVFLAQCASKSTCHIHASRT